MIQVVAAIQSEPETGVSTILSGHARIPIDCDACGHSTAVNLADLQKYMRIRCRFCGQERTFSHAELTVTRAILARAGYHFSRQNNR